MVVVEFPQSDGNRLRLRVTGHAGHGTRGNDPVCGAVSALLLTFLGGMETEVGADITGTAGDGECDVVLEVPVGRREAASMVAGVFRYGFRRLSETYPDAVIVKNGLSERGCNNGA